MCCTALLAKRLVCMYVCMCGTMLGIHSTYSTYIYTLMIRIRWTPMYVLLFDICKYSVGAIFNVCNVCMYVCMYVCTYAISRPTARRI